MEYEAWALYDARTGKRCSMESYSTVEQAAYALERIRKRDAEGKRKDIHDLIPHLGFVKLTPETWGSNPGDVIDGRDTT